MRHVLGFLADLAGVGVAVRWLIFGIGLALGLVLAGMWQQTRLQAVQVEFAQYKAAQAAALADARSQAQKAEQRVTRMEQELQEVADEKAREAAELQARLDAASFDLSAAEQRLRDAYAAAPGPGKRPAAGKSADVAQRGAGEPSDAAARVRAIVHGRTVEALSRVGRYADELRVRGLTAEQTLDAWRAVKLEDG